MEDSNNSIMTLEQAAHYLQITIDELQEEINNGRIHAVKIANKWRLRKDEIDKLFNSDVSFENQTSPTINSDEQVKLTIKDKESHDDINTTSNSDSQQGISEYTPLTPGFVRGKVFAYNPSQGYGYARLIDNRVVWLDSQQLMEKKARIPMPGDMVEFEIIMKKGMLQGKSIKIVLKYDIKKQGYSQSRVESLSDSDSNDIKPVPPVNNKQHSNDKSTKNIPVKGTISSTRFYEKAALARTEGRFDDAKRYFRQAIEAGASVQIHTTYIKFLLERGIRSEAIKAVEDSIGRFPDQAVFYDMYGQMERRARNYDAAIKIFRAGIKRISNSVTNINIRNGLAQSLVQKGTESSLKEAGEIYQSLIKERKLNLDDRYYQRYKVFQRNARANRIYDFFQSATMKLGVAGKKDLPWYATDLVVEIENSEFRESFGLGGQFIVRCFQRKPQQIDLISLRDYISKLGTQGVVGLQDGREVVINPSLAFIAVEDTDHVRDQIMNILSQNSEAIIPIDDVDAINTNPLKILRDLFAQYLGQRDLYAGTMPVSGRRFFGREQLLIQLTDDIYHGEFLGIFGLRKMGKTSLVYQLRDQKLSSEAVAYVDLQASPSITLKSCYPVYYELERDLYLRLQKVGIEADKYLRLGKFERYTELPESNPNLAVIFLEDIRTLLDQIDLGQLGNIKRLIIVLDELERILPVGGQPGSYGYLELFAALRGLAQTERYRSLLSSVVVAANAAISEKGYWEGRENPVFALYKSIFLPPLSNKECEEMIRSLGKGMSVYWDEDALAEVYKETGGHPFITRSLCSKIIKKNLIRPLTVNLSMVVQEATAFVRDDGDKLQQITELLRVNFPEEESFLIKIALQENIGDIPDESVKHLLEYNLIVRDAESYKVKLNLLRRWLRRFGGLRE